MDNTLKLITNKSQVPAKSIERYEKDLTTYQDLKDYYESYEKPPNRTQIGVIFCGNGVPQVAQLSNFCDGTKDYSYYLVMNKTDSLAVIFHDML